MSIREGPSDSKLTLQTPQSQLELLIIDTIEPFTFSCTLIAEVLTSSSFHSSLILGTRVFVKVLDPRFVNGLRKSVICGDDNGDSLPYKWNSDRVHAYVNAVSSEQVALPCLQDATTSDTQELYLWSECRQMATVEGDNLRRLHERCPGVFPRPLLQARTISWHSSISSELVHYFESSVVVMKYIKNPTLK